MSPYLCIAPACGPECSDCNHAISPDAMRKNAVRYALLQRMDPRFGMPVEWMRFKTLDEAVDNELAAKTEADLRRADASEPSAEQKAQRNDAAALDAQIARLPNGGYLS